MEFKILSDYLAKKVAIPAAEYLSERMQSKTLKIEKELNTTVSWRPTFYLPVNKRQIYAVEVSDKIYPGILDSAALDLMHGAGNHLVSVYVACPLDVWQSDPRLAEGKRLQARGFGLLTVDDTGVVTEQFNCVPIVQFISRTEVTEKVKPLTSELRRRFNQAHDTYRAKPVQGMQDAGQIVEGVIKSLAKQAQKAGYISSTGRGAADVLDDLYTCTTSPLKDHRANIGAARDFLKHFRNASSHPPHSSKDALEREKNSREGFLLAIRVTVQLSNSMKLMGFTPKIY